MKRTREYIDVSVNQKQFKTLRRGKVALIRLPGGTMMSLALRDNLKWRRYLKAKRAYVEAKRVLKKV